MSNCPAKWPSDGALMNGCAESLGVRTPRLAWWFGTGVVEGVGIELGIAEVRGRPADAPQSFRTNREPGMS